tara:strand:+ start:295 stop:1338 length:1044 start_codon:yes stop_codon:yes gene_type:complete
VRKIDKIKISKHATIKQALKIISEGSFRIAIVVDKKDKLLGILTDGNIRRGFLKGLNINSSIKSIIFKKPIVAKKNDSKEKLLQLAISKKIYQIPVVDRNGKAIGVHVLDELIAPKDKSNKVVIMAGGKGMRLRPLTKNIPKPMLKIGNKPILQTIVERFRESGYKNLVMCVNHKSSIIKNYFGNGIKFGVNIEYINEKKKMGTAGALSLIKTELTKPFFVINGDLMINLDFEKMLDFHNENNSKATMCIAEYNLELPYGEVKLNNENIKSIEEKPIHKIFVNAGVYILDPKCIKLVPKKFYDMPSLFKKIIASKKKTISFPIHEYWVDIGRFDDYKRAKVEYPKVF